MAHPESTNSDEWLSEAGEWLGGRALMNGQRNKEGEGRRSKEDEERRFPKLLGASGGLGG
uniref:Uncharacterized protein n=1 Tax=Fagus sylvatica TaxID=28930 RepID=A0A2N9INV8_FAGSY